MNVVDDVLLKSVDGQFGRPCLYIIVDTIRVPT